MNGSGSAGRKDIVSTTASYAVLQFFESGKKPDLMSIIQVLIADVAGEAFKETPIGQKILRYVPEIAPDLIDLRSIVAVNAAAAIINMVSGKKISESTIAKLTTAKIIGNLLDKADIL